MDKQNIRKTILAKRNSLSKEEIKKRSAIIKERLFSSHLFKSAKTIMFYASFGSEVDTHDMIDEALKEKKVCIPTTEEHEIIPSLIENVGDLDKKGKYNIPEPSIMKKINKSNIDLVIVPGIAFDKENHRIGYGKGYYDSFLKDFKGKKIGLAFDIQMVDNIHKERWDIKLDKVISD